jgi:hypothetical protein
MTFMNRLLCTGVCIALLGATACTGSPTDPSASSSGATISGLVSGSNGAGSSSSTSLPRAAATTSASGLTVAIEGTDRSAAVDASGHFQFTDVPPGDVRLRFSGNDVNATILIANVGSGEQIAIQVSVGGGTAALVEEVRSAHKVQLCHQSGTGQYHMIEVSTNAEPAHRAHGDGKVGDPVPGTLTKVFSGQCLPMGAGVNIEKLTNDQDADVAPGPSIDVGDLVTWKYVVTNVAAVLLSGVTVTDSKGVLVDCGLQTTLAIGASMTCTGSAPATLGPYSNVGTVNATSSNGPYSDSDPSHYVGVPPVVEPPGDGPKVQLCHRTGAGFYVSINVGISAEPAHRAHGDGTIGESVPGNVGKTFGPGCTVVG